MTAQSFFRWRPAAIALWIFGVLFGLTGALNVWLATLASAGRIHDARVGDSSRLAHLYFRGAAENVGIAVLCILGWYFMRRRTSPTLLIGALAVGLGLFITLRRWIVWQTAGTNTLPWVEPLLVWPFLAYAIVYAYRQSRLHAA
jgi:hypothetical protein